MKRVFVSIIMLASSLYMSAQSSPEQSKETDVKWYTIEEAEKLIKKDPRPIFIDTYTDWCGYCKKLDAEVFSNQEIIKILNNNYYPVKFDAESTEPVVFQGKTYVNDGKLGKAHQLAYALLSGKLSYPTVVFLNDKAQLITPVPGYRPAKDFELILMYFAGTEWQTVSFEDFAKTFTGKIK